MTSPYPSDLDVGRMLTQRGVNVVMNELAIRKLGFKSPVEAVGKVLKGQMFEEERRLVASAPRHPTDFRRSRGRASDFYGLTDTHRRIGGLNEACPCATL
jgi:hypothetical protein